MSEVTGGYIARDEGRNNVKLYHRFDRESAGGKIYLYEKGFRWRYKGIDVEGRQCKHDYPEDAFRSMDHFKRYICESIRGEVYHG